MNKKKYLKVFVILSKFPFKGENAWFSTVAFEPLLFIKNVEDIVFNLENCLTLSFIVSETECASHFVETATDNNKIVKGYLT